MKQLIHAFRCLSGLDLPNSQTTLNEQNTIERYASDAKHAVEIGVFEGVNTAKISSVLSDNGRLYAIDPFFTGRLGISYEKIIAMAHAKKHGVIGKIQWVRKLSFDAANDVPQALDFMFIDGDHSLDGIEKDWKLFSSKIVTGGHVLLHDSFEFNNSTRMGSHEYFENNILKDDRFEFIEKVDSLAVMRRK